MRQRKQVRAGRDVSGSRNSDGVQRGELVAALLPGGEPVESLLRRAQFWAYVSRCTDLRDGLSGGRSVDTDELPLPGGMKLAEFLQEVRHGRAGEWVAPEEKTDVRPLRSPGRLAAEPEGIRQSPHTGSALAVLVPVRNLASQGS